MQTDWPNNCDNNYGTTQLLELFNQDLKIDIKPIHGIANKSAHISGNTLITFVPRKPLDEKLIVIVTPSYNNKDWWEWNLSSLLNQNYKNYYILITDDCSTDGTGDALENYITSNNLEHKVKLIRNKKRRGALYNHYMMIHGCPNEAIIANVDGDDKLPDDPEILNRLNMIYSLQDVWLTYGQFVEYPSGQKGWCCPIPENIVKNNSFREFTHLPSHLRTYYTWLFKCIKLEDLLDRTGNFYSMTCDYAMMLPMIEMAGERHLCIQDQIMYVYNSSNNLSDHKISRQLQAHIAQVICAKKRYNRLPESAESFAQNLENEKADWIIFAEDANPELLERFIISIQHKVTGTGEVYILYLSWPTTVEKYKELKERYSTVNFLAIDENRTNFKELLTNLYHYQLKHNYVLFSLANNIVEQPINLTDCIQALEETQAYSFSLKLSKENSCYPLPKHMPLLEIHNDICAWNYACATDMWACANSVDLMLYRRKTPTISSTLQNYWMYSWIHFVGWWSQEGNLDKIGLCFKYPKIEEVK